MAGILSFLALAFPVFSPAVPGTQIENVAHAEYRDRGGFVYTISSPAAITTVGDGYSLHIDKETETSVCLPSDTVIFHIRLQNSGNIAASSAEVRDTLSTDLIYHASQPSATVNGSVLSWDLQNIEAGAASDILVSAVVAPDVPPGTTIENTASFRTPDNIRGYSAPVTVSIGSKPDPWLLKTVDRSTAGAGDTLNYTISAGNSGNVAATQSLLYDDLPDHTVFLSASGNATYQSGILSWNIGNLDPGETLQEQVRVLIEEDVVTGTLLSNTASLSSAEDLYRNATAVTQIVEETGEPILQIEKTVSSAVASPGDTLVFGIAYANTGNAIATESLIADSLSPQMEFLSASGDYSYDAGTHILSWETGDLDPGMRDSLTVTVKTATGIADGSVLQNRVSVACNEGITASATATVNILSPILSLQKQAVTDRISAGKDLQYTFKYRNTGNASASNVMIRDTLPAEVGYVSSDGTSTYDAEHRVVYWTLGTLPANMASEQTLTLTVNVRSPLENGTLINNTAQMSCSEGFAVTASESVSVESEVTLVLHKSGPPKAFPGDTLAYVFSFSNQGNAVATLSGIRDTLPAQLEPIQLQGSWTYDPATRALYGDIGDLDPGTDSSFTLKARVTPEIDGVLILNNTAHLHSEQGSAVSNTVQTTVTSLNLQISADPDSIFANGESFSDIRATITDASGQPLPDGAFIVFSSSDGRFLPGTDTVMTANGVAETRLYSEKIDSEFRIVGVHAELLRASVELRDSINVVFYSRNIVGNVTDSDDHPIPGAVVMVFLNDDMIGSDTTSADGYYSIPVYESGHFTIVIIFSDQGGTLRRIEYHIDVDLSGDEIRIIQDQCALSGRIMDAISGEPVRKAGIQVLIRAVDDTPMAKTLQQGVFSDTSFTDSSGFWYFSDLDPGTYSIEVLTDAGGNYHSGSRVITLDSPGQYMMNANLSLRPFSMRAYKMTATALAFPGDTLDYRIVYESLDYVLGDTIRITDDLPDELEWIPGTQQHASDLIFDGYDPVAHELRFHRSGMAANQRDSVRFSARVRDDISASVTIMNRVTVLNSNDTVYTENDPRTEASTQIVTPFLLVKKKVNRRVIESGDVLTYTVTLENRSMDMPLTNIVIDDILPPGFRYREGRSVWNGQISGDPLLSDQAERQLLSWVLQDTLQPGASQELKYRVIAGLESRLGENSNTVTATADLPGGMRITSNIASAEVVLKPTSLMHRGFIFGKVFFDHNHNGMHDRDEETVKGVEIISEDGIRVRTDEYGKYSIPNVSPGDHVLRINMRSLPEHSQLVLAASDFLGDSRSRLVKVRPGAMAKANFVLKSTKALSETDSLKVHPEHEIRKMKASRKKEVRDERQSVKTMADSAALYLSQRALTQSLRLMVDQPWSILLNLEFSPGTAMPTQRDECMLDEFVDFLTWQDHLNVTVRGHTDNQPVRLSPFKNNMELSKARAEAVESYLERHGIDPARIRVEAYGDTRPLKSNLYMAGRLANRRVELLLCMQENPERPKKALGVLNEILYQGGLPLQHVRLISELPEGFSLEHAGELPGSASIKRDPEGKDTLVLEFGTWEVALKKELNYILRPADHSRILTQSTLTTWLEYKTPENETAQTEKLRITVPTLVEEDYFYVIFDDANFNIASSNLKIEALPELNRLGHFLQWQENMHIRVEGFTDSTGSREGNQQLSQQRADSVKRYLIKHFGIAEERIETLGYGEEYPIVPNNTAAGRAKNRRVEIVITSEFRQAISNDKVRLQDALRHREVRQDGKTSMNTKDETGK
jgi:uncharacterized repeat protein (TIGR01451 family)